MVQPLQLGHANIRVRDVERSEQFYTEVLGLHVTHRRGGTVFELYVAPGDLGRVIGRQGRTAAALRTLLQSAGEASGKRVTLDIRD